MITLDRKNRRVGLMAGGIILGMTGLAWASVPLYDLFCRVTGYGGTTGVSAGYDGAIADVAIQVSFNADVDPSLPWSFQPLQRSVTIAPGENGLAFYEAINRSDQPVVGRAVYNVTPHKVGYYFNKVHCFCFEEQLLEPGERIEMPVSYYVDPEMLDDVEADMVRQITLSYTFFIDEDATAALRAERDGTS